MTDTPLPSNLGLRDAARFLRKSPRWLRGAAKQGIVPGTKIGREWLFSRSVLQAWIDDRCRAGSSAALPIRNPGAIRPERLHGNRNAIPSGIAERRPPL